MRTKSLFSLLALLSTSVLTMSVLTGCHTTPRTEEGRENLGDEVQTALNRFERSDPDLKHFLDTAAGYAMFPSVGKAGFIAGAAYGKGQAFQNNTMIGYSDIRQGSVGLQAGAQDFSELVVFGTNEALEKFKAEKLEFGANASAIVLKAGAAKAASFRDGVAVFTQARSGAMVELSISGQKFTFSSPGNRGESTETSERRMNTETTETKTTERRETESR